MARKSDIQYIRFYTDGSAARKIEPVRPQRQRRPVPKAHRRKRVTIQVDPVALAGIVLSVVLLVMMISGVKELRSAKQELAQMERYVQVLSADNALMEKTVNEEYDMKDVEEKARALGLVPVEEVRHIGFKDNIPVEPERMPIWEQIRGFISELFA